MHPADDGVGFDHEVAARGRFDHGGIVAEPEGAGMLCDGRKVPRDQAVFGGLLPFLFAHCDRLK